jgi:hypothetical protein
MTFDPFFDVNVATTADLPTRHVHSVLIGFFLCSFDNINGVQILYSSPAKLRKDLNELSVLKTHCIWKMEKIPLRIDLRFSEFNYSAFQLDINQHYSFTDIEQPIFVVVLKIWKAGKKIPARRFFEFKTNLEQSFSKDTQLLYKHNILAKNPTRKREFRELSSKMSNIEKKLKKLWKNFEEQIDKYYFLHNGQLEDEVNISPIPKEEGICTKDLFKVRIRMRTIATDENPNHLILVLINQGEDLEDVRIQVSKSTDFFSETHWEQRLEIWPRKEEIFLEFFKDDEIQKYLIKVSSHETTVTIKSLEVGKSISHVFLEEPVQN